MIASSRRSIAVRSALTSAVAAFALGCGAPAHQNPFDPLSPPAVQAKATLAGVVSLEGLSPGALAGTRVDLVGLGLSANTAADGSFQIGNVPAGTWSVQASRAGFSPASATGLVVTLSNGDQNVAVPALRLTRLTVAVSGTVSLVAGGIAGFTPEIDRSGIAVVLRAADPSDVPAALVAITSASGDFTFPSVPYSVTGKSYSLSASRPGYVTATQSVAVVPPAVPPAVGLALSARSSAARGCVFVPPATSGGTPDSITAVTAQLSGTSFNGATFAATGALAADSGSLCGVAGAAVFTFSSVPDGTYSIALARPAYNPPANPTVNVAGGDAQVSPLLTRLVRAAGAVGGTVTFQATSFSPGVTGFDVTKARAGAVVTLDGAELSGGHLVTTTDSTGQFFFPSVPANVAGHYTVTVSQTDFVASSAGSDTATVVVTPNATTPATGLSLQVRAATLQVSTLFRDHDQGQCFTPSVPMTVGACTIATCAGDAPGAGVSVTITGAAFTGDAIFANPVVASGAGIANFQLPPGSYTVSSAPAGRSPDAAYPTAVAGQTACATLALRDRIAPTAPTIQSQIASPTSSVSASIALVQPSTDGTQPSSNFTGYLYRVCSPTCPAATAYSAWPGTAPLNVSLTNGVDNNVEVRAGDDAGNLSASAFVTVHRESVPPPQPANVHVDNRNGSARITWDAVVTPTSVPVAGYNVYYGPVLSSNYADYTGNFVSQGPTPIFVPGVNNTSLTLTGLSNASPFFVTVAAVDSVVSPAPNVSPDVNRPYGFKVNPNVAPLDRAVHLDLTGSWSNPSLLDSLTVLRDRAFVSQGTAVASPSCGAGKPTNVPPFKILEYNYDHYGQSGLTPVGAVPFVSQRARDLVADGDRFIYGFDSGLGPDGVGLTRQPGIDVLDAAIPGSLSLASTVFAVAPVAGDVRHPGPLNVDALIPWRRADAGGEGTTHGLFVYQDGANTRWLGTFAYASDHRSIAGCDLNTTGTACNAVQLADQGTVRDVKTVGQIVIVLHDQTIEAYSISNDFHTISLPATGGKRTLPSGWMAHAAIAVAPPRIYFSHVVGQGLSALFETSLSGVNLSAPVQIATLHDAATHLLLAGGQLIASEDMQQSDSAVEVFSLANPDAPQLAGSYLTDDIAGNDIGDTASISSAVLYGSTLFLLERDTSPSCYGQAIVDVVEMGSLRTSSRLPELHVDNIAPQQIKLAGDRAIGLLGYGPFELAAIDLATLSSTPTARSANFANQNQYPTDSTGRGFLAMPLALAGDYAFTVSGSASCASPYNTPGCTQLAVYDISSPAALNGAGPVNTPTDIAITRAAVTTQTPVRELVAANGYLYGAAISNTDALLRWDIRNPLAPVGPTTIASPTQVHGRSVDAFGKWVFVGTATGFCVVDGAAMTELGCVTVPGCAGGIEVIGIHADASRLYLSTNFSPTGVCGSDDHLEIWDATPLASNQMPKPLQTVFQSGYLAANGMIKRSGPQLFSAQGTSSNFAGLVGYDLPGTPHLQNTVSVSSSSPLVFDAQGSLALVPDYPTGLVPVRLY